VSSRSRRAPLAVAAAAVLSAALALGVPPAIAARPPTERTISVRVGSGSFPVPLGFQGISIESSDVPGYAAGGARLKRVLSLVRAPYAPLTVRVGGTSADRMWWLGLDRPALAGVMSIGPQWLSALRTIAASVPERVVLTVNLANDDPDGEARFALAAHLAMPAGTLAAVEIGNEPDLYGSQRWLWPERPRLPNGAPWTLGYSPARYRVDYLNYARAMRRVLPHIALQAPDVTQPQPLWLLAPIGADGLSAGQLAVHRYPLSYCLPPQSSYYPTEARLLSASATADLAASLDQAEWYARARGAHLYVSEFNSVSCAGAHLLPHSFATALWGLDALFELARAGLAGVEWHIRPGFANAPFSLGAHDLVIRPELYSMAIFARIDSPGARILRTAYPRGRNVGVRVWAIADRDRLTVVLINKTRARATIDLQLPTDRGGWLRRLSGNPLRYGDQWIGGDGRWHGRLKQLWTRRRQGGHYLVTLPPLSAATLITRPRRSAALLRFRGYRGPRARADRAVGGCTLQRCPFQCSASGTPTACSRRLTVLYPPTMVHQSAATHEIPVGQVPYLATVGVVWIRQLVPFQISASP
jgi:hypothetical protein